MVWMGRSNFKGRILPQRGGTSSVFAVENAGTRGGQSFVQSKGYHNELTFKLQIAVLATLAKLTNRILVLPQELSSYYAQPLWIYLDLGKTLRCWHHLS